MADVVLQLVIDPATGKKHVVVHYESDDDAMAHEHEDAHRALVAMLVKNGVLGPDEAGQIVIERASSVEPETQEDPGAAREALALDE